MRRAQDRAWSATISSRALGALKLATEASCARSARWECAREAGRFLKLYSFHVYYMGHFSKWWVIEVQQHRNCTQRIEVQCNILLNSQISGYIACSTWNLFFTVLRAFTDDFFKTRRLWSFIGTNTMIGSYKYISIWWPRCQVFGVSELFLVILSKLEGNGAFLTFNLYSAIQNTTLREKSSLERMETSHASKAWKDQSCSRRKSCF